MFNRLKEAAQGMILPIDFMAQNYNAIEIGISIFFSCDF